MGPIVCLDILEKRNIVAPGRIGTPNRQSSSIVAILDALWRFHFNKRNDLKYNIINDEKNP